MKVKLVGYRDVQYTSKNGRDVDAWELYFENDNLVSDELQGVVTDKSFLPKKMVKCDLLSRKLPYDVEVDYGPDFMGQVRVSSVDFVKSGI